MIRPVLIICAIAALIAAAWVGAHSYAQMRVRAAFAAAGMSEPHPPAWVGAWSSG